MAPGAVVNPGGSPIFRRKPDAWGEPASIIEINRVPGGIRVHRFSNGSAWTWGRSG
jgi:hypothetical protein